MAGKPRKRMSCPQTLPAGIMLLPTPLLWSQRLMDDQVPWKEGALEQQRTGWFLVTLHRTCYTQVKLTKGMGGQSRLGVASGEAADGFSVQLLGACL